jgi:tetratricopeptide (TPR) repeat protein
MGQWNPQEEYWGEPDESIDMYFKPIIDYGVRESYEMEQIIPFQDPEDFESDPIIEASDYYSCGNVTDAQKIMEKILTADLRCLDAHAHLGNWDFDSKYRIDKAKKHYEVGVKIGELSFSNEFNGVLPWGHIDNRPYLRCLHGYGLALWRMNNPKEARKVFNRMLWLNPTDNQGIRFLLADIDAGKTWQECTQ